MKNKSIIVCSSFIIDTSNIVLVLFYPNYW